MGLGTNYVPQFLFLVNLGPLDSQPAGQASWDLFSWGCQLPRPRNVGLGRVGENWARTLISQGGKGSARCVFIPWAARGLPWGLQSVASPSATSSEAHWAVTQLSRGALLGRVEWDPPPTSRTRWRRSTPLSPPPMWPHHMLPACLGTLLHPQRPKGVPTVLLQGEMRIGMGDRNVCNRDFCLTVLSL